MQYFSFIITSITYYQVPLFPTALKYTDVKLNLKKNDKTDKKNSRSIIILPTLIKANERLITKCIRALINFLQNSIVIFEKVLMLNT